MPRGGHTKRNYLHLSKLRRQTQNKITINKHNQYIPEGGREGEKEGGREGGRKGGRRREEGREKKGTEERKRRSSTFN